MHSDSCLRPTMLCNVLTGEATTLGRLHSLPHGSSPALSTVHDQLYANDLELSAMVDNMSAWTGSPQHAAQLGAGLTAPPPVPLIQAMGVDSLSDLQAIQVGPASLAVQLGESAGSSGDDCCGCSRDMPKSSTSI